MATVRSLMRLVRLLRLCRFAFRFTRSLQPLAAAFKLGPPIPSITVKAQVLGPADVCSDCCRQQQSRAVDMDTCVWVDGWTLRSVGMRPGDAATCRLSPSTRRPCRLLLWPFACDRCRPLPARQAFVSAQFAYNSLNGDCKMTPLDKALSQIQLSKLSSADIARWASVVKVALLRSPHYSDNADVGEALSRHFLTPRLLSLSDVFFIDDHSLEFSARSDGRRRFCFRVCHIVADETGLPTISSSRSESANDYFWVQSKSSKLYQLAHQNGFAPQQQFVQPRHFDCEAPFWSRSRPVVFEQYIEQIADLVRLCSETAPIVLYGSAGCGKRWVAQSAACRLNAHFYPVDCRELWSDVVGTADAKLRNAFKHALNFAPVLIFLRAVDVLGFDPNSGQTDSRIAACFLECVQLASSDCDFPVAVVASTSASKRDCFSAKLASAFLYEIEIQNLSETDRECLLGRLTDAQLDVNLHSLAQQTAGFALADLAALTTDARRLAAERRLRATDAFEAALELHHSLYADAIGAPKIPDVRWEDVGGLDEAKRLLLETVQTSLEHPELARAGMRRSGILLHGPPGCGKTLLAKAVARECRLTFLAVKGPELLNMYVGQSEQNVREVFERARAAAPCVLFFDEVDSLAPARGRSGDSAGVMDRVVSQLLAELDGARDNGRLFVVGATNRADLLDAALLRPGRFDKLVHVRVGAATAERVRLLRAVTRRLPLAADVSLQRVEQHCPADMSGADFYALAAAAAASAAARAVRLVDCGAVSADDVEFRVSADDVHAALRLVRPAAVQSELHHTFADVV